MWEQRLAGEHWPLFQHCDCRPCFSAADGVLRGINRQWRAGTGATQIAHLPPTAALFGAFLGYNPVAQLLLPATLQHLNPQNQAVLLGKTFFPNLISGPFMVGLHAIFCVSAGLCIIAAMASYLRGRYTTYKADTLASGAIASDGSLTGAGGSTTVPEPAYA